MASPLGRSALLLTTISLLATSAASAALRQDPGDAPSPEVAVPEVPELWIHFEEGVERPWLAPELFANRFPDWRLAKGRAECVEGARRAPMRTLQVLTAALEERTGSFRLAVKTGPLEPWSTGTPASWAGFLIGAGGAHVDPRLSAQVHGRPGADGGLVCAVDGTGQVVFRDNERNVVPGSFTIAGPLHEEELRELPVAARDGAALGGAPFLELELVLVGKPTGSSYALTLSALERGTGRVLSRARLDRVEPERVEGALALVSHRGPEGSAQGHWFDDLHFAGEKLFLHPERAFGPIFAALYTVSDGELHLSAQVAPLAESGEGALQVLPPGEDAWRTVALAPLEGDASLLRFVVDPWDPDVEVPYRVVYPAGAAEGAGATYSGLLRAQPVGDEPFVLAALSGAKHFTGGIAWNHDGLWFPHADIAAAVEKHDPDLLFFAGDQVYDADLAAPARTPIEAARLDYLHRWAMWCQAFGDLARTRPCVCLPGDGDVYQEELWGSGGRHAERPDDGGYTMPPRFVALAERTQTSHLPAPYDATPAGQGIGVHYTSLEWGGISFALLEDHKFKSAPKELLPGAQVVDGWFRAQDFDAAADADVEDATLLGERQLEFLRAWADDWRGGAWMKVALSGGVFADPATLPDGARDDLALLDLPVPPARGAAPDARLAADAGSNAWPPAGRRRALELLRRAAAVHIGGDRGLAFALRYGIDDWDDAGAAFSVPAIANPLPRRYLPAETAEGEGDGVDRMRDGFGNLASLLALAGPRATGIEPAALYDRAPGYGIVRFDRASRSTTFEAWPRWIDPAHKSAEPFPGWPLSVHQTDNLGAQASLHLPMLLTSGCPEPVVRVVDEATGEPLYSLRVRGSFRAPVPAPGSYRIEVRDPERDVERVLEGVQAPAEVTLLRVEL